MAYEAFALKTAAVDLVIRAAQGRALDGGDQLFACLAAAPEAGRFVVDLALGPFMARTGGPEPVPDTAKIPPAPEVRARKLALVRATSPSALTPDVDRARR